MINEKQSKNFSKELISLFFLLISMLGVAFWVSGRDYHIKAGGLVHFKYAAVAAALPEGDGWTDRNVSWTFSEKESLFFLHANFRGSEGIRAGLEWRYLLAVRAKTVSQAFRDKATELAATMNGRGIIKADGLVFRWVSMQNIPKQLYFYYAIATTSDNRTIELDVWSKTDQGLAKEIFFKIAPIFKSEKNKLLYNGRILVSRTKSRTINKLTDRNRMRYFLIKRDTQVTGLSVKKISKRKVEGNYIYTVDAFSHVDNAQQWRNTNINFNSNLDFKNYAIRYNVQSSNTAVTQQIVQLCDQGKYLKILTAGDSNPKYYTLSEVAFPEPMLSQLYKEFLSSNLTSSMVDLVMPGGYIFPIVLERGEAKGSRRCLNIHYLQDEDSIAMVHFDKRGNITSKSLPSENLVTLRSTKYELIKYYGVFRDLINKLTEGK